MIIFDRQMDIPIVTEESAEEAILLAAGDLQKNLRRLSGKENSFDIITVRGNRGIFIQNANQGVPESYTVKIDSNQVLITGTDTLGTIYGIYAFATKCLNIQPVYRLVDLFPAQRESLILDEQILSSTSRHVRFRGWFLNDEDLLTELKISGGTRDIDYDFYKNVMHIDVLDMVLETALRLEMNLVIPASFMDIDNPDEEKLVQAVCRRGMYISQHHVEPMGVSYFGADNYLRKYGFEGEEVSFIKHRARMVEIWTHYAQKWAKYGDRVVWQLGLRGKADQAVWQSDPNIPNSMENRGAIISDAISTQYDIIRKTLNSDDFQSTATLWNEGSELYGKGYLKLPKNTIPIFSDLGLDQMFGEDLYTIGHRMDQPYGIYYHVGFWTLGPHLTEGCNPQKMAYCYHEASKTGQLCYSIVNISNVRPLHVSALMNARILDDPCHCDIAQELLKWDQTVFGDFGEDVNELRKIYYESFADFGNTPLKIASDAWHFYYREYATLSFIRNAATDGQLAFFGKALVRGKVNNKLPVPNQDTKAVLAGSEKAFANLYVNAEELEKKIPEDTLLYFKQFIKYPILHMQMLTQWDMVCIDLTDKTLPLEFRRERAAFGCACLETILEERTILEQGEWNNYHRGDKKINIRELLRLTDLAKDGELYER